MGTHVHPTGVGRLPVEAAPETSPTRWKAKRAAAAGARPLPRARSALSGGGVQISRRGARCHLPVPGMERAAADDGQCEPERPRYRPATPIARRGRRVLARRRRRGRKPFRRGTARLHAAGPGGGADGESSRSRRSRRPRAECQETPSVRAPRLAGCAFSRPEASGRSASQVDAVRAGAGLLPWWMKKRPGPAVSSWS